MNNLCPSCQKGRMTIFHSIKKFPVHTVLNMQTRDIAIDYPVGDINLGFCDKCGFISNLTFNEKLLHYSPDCEESQGYSATFLEFSTALANRLIETYNLREKTIIEIGCGKGEFLMQLCKLGGNKGIGFDPAYVENRFDDPVLDGIEFIKDYYSEKYVDRHADFICCKMTLEHIHETYTFVNTVRESIGNRMETVVFFQVPNVLRILKDCAFEDIYYEHCSYFSPGSLEKLFSSCSFQTLDIRSEYNSQYLTIEAKPVPKGTELKMISGEDVESLGDLVDEFSERFSKKAAVWRKHFDNFKEKDQVVVIWGSGSKGVAFLNAVVEDGFVQYVVDINPNRQGTFMAGSGQEIISPDVLIEYKPDVVIIMNEIYEEEITSELSKMGLYPEIYHL